MTLTVLVPHSVPDRQKIVSVNYTPRPDRIFTENGNVYARFLFRNLARRVEVRVNAEAELYRYDLSVASQKRSTKPEPRTALQKWLAAEKYLEKDAPDVRAAAQRVTGKTDVEMVRSVEAVVRKSLRYSGFNENDVGALGGLKAGHGDCTEFSDLFVALCRARNLPARVWEGYVTTDIEAGDTPKHSWAEVYLQGQGWVPFDPLHAAVGKTQLDKLRPVYVYMSPVRNDRVLEGAHAYRYVYRGQPIEVRSAFTVNRQEDTPSR